MLEAGAPGAVLSPHPRPPAAPPAFGAPGGLFLQSYSPARQRGNLHTQNESVETPPSPPGAAAWACGSAVPGGTEPPDQLRRGPRRGGGRTHTTAGVLGHRGLPPAAGFHSPASGGGCCHAAAAARSTRRQPGSCPVFNA